MTLACPGNVVAPFAWQPGRQGLRGLGSFGVAVGIPVGAGAGPGAMVGASQGASIGSAIVPGIGTAIGAVVGAISGAIAGSINKKDPEQYNFDAAVALWQQNPDAIYNIGNKYLVLAGLFDLNLDKSCSSKWCIPMYVRYGRMGEQRFTNDMVMQIYNAAQSGRITASDTPISIYNNIVQPWINSWNLGPLNDPHADLITRLLVGMVWDYTDGTWKQNWHATGGDFPFGNLPMFTLPQAQPAAPAAVTPTPAATPAPAVPAPLSPPSASIIPIPVGSTAVSTPVPVAPAASSSIQPVGSGITVATMPTAAQLVANPPAIGSPVTYVPDMSQGGIPIQLPVAGLIYNGQDPATRSWILQNPMNGSQYTVWQGTLQPYNTPAAVPVSVPQLPTASPTVATTSTGTPVTQADLQALVSQLASQGQTAQQAYTSALQTLQNSGIAATPAVQDAVQSAVQTTPTPTGVGDFLSSITTTGWVAIAGVAYVIFGRRHSHSHR